MTEKEGNPSQQLGKMINRRDAIKGAAAAVISLSGLPEKLITVEKVLGSSVNAVDEAVSSTTPSVLPEVMSELPELTRANIVDAIAEKLENISHLPSDSLWEWGESEETASQVFSLGDHTVELKHSFLKFKNGHQTESGEVNLYLNNDTAKNVSLFLRKDGKGIGRINEGIEFSDEDFGFNPQSLVTDESIANLARSNAYHFALRKQGFRDVDLDIMNSLVREAGNESSTLTSDKISRMLRLDELQKFNTYWSTEFADADFEAEHSFTDMDGYFLLNTDAYYFIGPTGKVDLMTKLNEFADMLRLGMQVVEGVRVVANLDNSSLEVLSPEQLAENFPLYEELPILEDMPDEFPLALEPGEFVFQDLSDEEPESNRTGASLY